MTKSGTINDLTNPAHPLVDGAPRDCARCAALLCLRKQVVNLALGNTDEMLCLRCLARENGQPEQEILSRLLSYIDSRECFRKEWARYSGIQYCPDAAGCLPELCFGKAYV